MVKHWANRNLEREGSFNLSIPCNISSVRKTGTRTQGKKPQVEIEVEVGEHKQKHVGEGNFACRFAFSSPLVSSSVLWTLLLLLPSYIDIRTQLLQAANVEWIPAVLQESSRLKAPDWDCWGPVSCGLTVCQVPNIFNVWQSLLDCLDCIMEANLVNILYIFSAAGFVFFSKVKHRP